MFDAVFPRILLRNITKKSQFCSSAVSAAVRCDTVSTFNVRCKAKSDEYAAYCSTPCDILREWRRRWRGWQELRCREFEERYEVEMKLMMTMMMNDDIKVSTEFLPADCLTRNKLKLTISSRTDRSDDCYTGRSVIIIVVFALLAVSGWTPQHIARLWFYEWINEWLMSNYSIRNLLQNLTSLNNQLYSPSTVFFVYQ